MLCQIKEKTLKLLKSHKRSLIAATVFVLLFFGVANITNAGPFDVVTGIMVSPILIVVATVNYLMGYVGGLFVFLGGNLVNWTLNLNTAVIQSPTVQTGWVITRDIANLGFVLAIILISFITILRLETFQTKQMLTKLIIAALLVNFSLVIAGVFIDFAGVVTDFFIDAATGGGGVSGFLKVGSGLANAFQVQKFLQPSADPGSILKLISTSTGLGLVPFVASIFFVTLFTVTAAISLLGLAAMLFIRYIVLNVLLILAPLAWLMWIWPHTAKHWTRWWNEFFRWVFFAPAISFFIYLALKLAEASPAKGGNLYFGASESLFDLKGLGITMKDISGVIGQMIAIVGLLFIGMIVSNEMGIIGAQATLGYANNFKGWLTGKARTAAQRPLRQVGAGITKGVVGSKVVQRFASDLMGYRVTRGVGSALKGLGARAEAGFTTKEDYENYQREYSDKKIYSNEDLLKRANLLASATLADPSEKAAVINEVATRGLIEDAGLKPQAHDSLMQSAHDLGKDKEILVARPDLIRTLKGTDFKEGDIRKETDKISIKEIADKLSAKAIKNSEVFSALTDKKIEAIIKEGTDEKRRALLEGLEQSWKATTDPEDRKRLRRQRTVLYTNPSMHRYLTPGAMEKVRKAESIGEKQKDRVEKEEKEKRIEEAAEAQARAQQKINQKESANS